MYRRYPDHLCNRTYVCVNSLHSYAYVVDTCVLNNDSPTVMRARRLHECLFSTGHEDGRLATVGSQQNLVVAVTVSANCRLPTAGSMFTMYDAIQDDSDDGNDDDEANCDEAEAVTSLTGLQLPYLLVLCMVCI